MVCTSCMIELKTWTQYVLSIIQFIVQKNSMGAHIIRCQIINRGLRLIAVWFLNSSLSSQLDSWGKSFLKSHWTSASNWYKSIYLIVLYILTLFTLPYLPNLLPLFSYLHAMRRRPDWLAKPRATQGTLALMESFLNEHSLILHQDPQWNWFDQFTKLTWLVSWWCGKEASASGTWRARVMTLFHI